MKINNLLNPFAKYSEKQLLVVGILSFILLIAVSYFFGMQLNGIFHIGYSTDGSWLSIAWQHFCIYGSAIVVLLVLAYFFNAKTRWVDVVNTVLVSSFPNVLIIIITSLPIFENASRELESKANQPEKLMQNTPELMIVLASSFFVIPMLVYSIILLYNGYKTATHMKSWWQINLFFGLLFILNLLTQMYF